MANKFIIEVQAKGFGRLESELKGSNKAMGDFDKKAGNIRGTTTGMRRAIGSLRNTLLLYTFAMAGAVKGTQALVGAASKFESLRTRLVGLTGSVKNAEVAFNNFNSVAATTPFTLEDVVEAGAQLQAFGADANALIKPITDLAAFMGTTAVEAANSFGRAFAGGAGAADVLREKGILNIIRSSQGIADLSKTTLPQFREALINSLQDPVVGIAGSTDRMSKTFLGATSNMQDSFTRLQAATGKAIINFTDMKDRMISIGGSVEAIAKQIDFMTDPIQNLTARLKDLGLEAKNLKEVSDILEAKETRDAIKEEDDLIVKLAEDLRKLPDIAPLFERNLSAIGDFLSFDTGSTNTLKGNLQEIGEAMLKTRDALTKDLAGADSAKDINTLVTNLEKVQKVIQLLQLDSEKTSISMEPDELNEVITMYDIFENLQMDANKDQADAAEAYAKSIQDRIDSFEEFTDVVVDNQQFIDEVQKESFEKVMTEDEQHKLNMDIKLADMDREKAKRLEVKNAIIEQAAAFKQFSDNLGRAVLEGQALGPAVVNSLQAIAAQIAAEAISFMILNMITGGGASAAEMGFSMLGAIGHKGGKVTNKGVQRFARGGSVMGGDNVPILAQSGEFIMKRDSVNSIGLDQLRQMNETGEPSQNVNINIHGGIVQEDFVRNELIPAMNQEGVGLVRS